MNECKHENMKLIYWSEESNRYEFTLNDKGEYDVYNIKTLHGDHHVMEITCVDCGEDIDEESIDLEEIL